MYILFIFLKTICKLFLCFCGWSIDISFFSRNESFQKAIVSFIAKKADVVFLKKEIKAVEDKDNQDEGITIIFFNV